MGSKQAFEKRQRQVSSTNTRKELEAKFETLPVDARWYVELISRDSETLHRAIRAHEQTCLTNPPTPDRVPYGGGTIDPVTSICVDPEAGMDDYIKLFVNTYCDLETLDCAEASTVN